MLPPFDCPDPEGGICCEALWKTANHILSVVAPDVINCVRATPCCPDQQFAAFVSQGEPNVWYGNYLACWYTSLTPSQKTQTNVGTHVTPAYLYRVGWNLRLCETGYPIVDEEAGGQKTVPGFDELHFVNRFVYSHGEMMLRSVLSNAQNGKLAPQGEAGFVFAGYAPIPTEAGTAGAQVSWFMDMSDWGI